MRGSLRLAIAGLAAAILCGIAGSASAASFVDSDYSAEAAATVGFSDAQSQSGSGEANFDANVAPFAEFRSTSQQMRASSSGEAQGSFTPGAGGASLFLGTDAEASLSVLMGDPLPSSAQATANAVSTFRVEMDSFYDFTWTSTTSSLTNDGYTVSFTQTLRFEDEMGMILFESVLTDEEAFEGGDLDGVLAPGLYTLTAISNVEVSGEGILGALASAEGNFSGTITPVPEPGTAMLIGLGLAILGRRPRRD